MNSTASALPCLITSIRALFAKYNSAKISTKFPNIGCQLYSMSQSGKYTYINTLTWTVSVCPSVMNVTQRDAVPFRGSICELPRSTALVQPQIFRSVQLTLSVSEPLTQTNTNSIRLPLQIVAHLGTRGLLSPRV